MKFDQLNDQLCGNLCRCTGYRSIIESGHKNHFQSGISKRQGRLLPKD